MGGWGVSAVVVGGFFTVVGGVFAGRVVALVGGRVGGCVGGGGGASVVVGGSVGDIEAVGGGGREIIVAGSEVGSEVKGFVETFSLEDKGVGRDLSGVSSSSVCVTLFSVQLSQPKRASIAWLTSPGLSWLETSPVIQANKTAATAQFSPSLVMALGLNVLTPAR